jgi:hypothetical protein
MSLRGSAKVQNLCARSCVLGLRRMKSRYMLLVMALLAGTAGGAIGAVAIDRYGAMPNGWAAWSQVAESAPAGAPNALGGVVGQVTTRAMPDGGPQALEGYTYMAHDAGTTRLAIGVIGNVELAGAGNAAEVRVVQSSGFISGTGKVKRWVGVSVHRPAGAAGKKVPFYPIVVSDPDAQTILHGTIVTDRIRFSNGWTLQPGGASMQLIDQRGVVRQQF